MNRAIFVFVVLVHLGVLNAQQMFTGSVHHLPAEKKLVRSLLDRYAHIGTTGRPAHNESFVVEHGLSFNHMAGLDEDRNQMYSSVWYKFRWDDMYLRWDPTNYDNITAVRLPSDMIWTPDVLLFNEVGHSTPENTLAMVYSSGTVLWIPRTQHKSVCALTKGGAEQTCTLKFGSWTYDESLLDLQFFDGVERADVTFYVVNNAWDLIAHSAKRNEVKYECCLETYVDLTYSFTFIRV